MHASRLSFLALLLQQLLLSSFSSFPAIAFAFFLFFQHFLRVCALKFRRVLTNNHRKISESRRKKENHDHDFIRVRWYEVGSSPKTEKDNCYSGTRPYSSAVDDVLTLLVRSSLFHLTRVRWSPNWSACSDFAASNVTTTTTTTTTTLLHYYYYHYHYHFHCTPPLVSIPSILRIPSPLPTHRTLFLFQPPHHFAPSENVSRVSTLAPILARGGARKSSKHRLAALGNSIGSHDTDEFRARYSVCDSTGSSISL